MNGINGKVIIITGASSGIGEITAKVLGEGGAKLVLAARRTDRLDALAAEINAGAGEAIAMKVDVSQRGDVEALIAKTIETHGQIDVLINNAGIMPVAPMAMTKVDDWDKMIDVNVKGLLYGIGAALPHMKEKGTGHIINVASVAGLKVFPNFTVYCATKHAVRAISEGLRMESPELRVTTISPGLIATELENSTPDEEIRAGVKEFYDEHAIPAQTIADAIAYAVAQPDSVDINEMVIRPTTQEL